MLSPRVFECYTLRPMAKNAPETIFVTGAAGALGSAVTKRFLEAGCQVVASFHRRAGEALPGLQWVQADLGNPASVRALGPRIRGADAWIHCAGGFRWTPAEKSTDDDLDFLIDANLRSALLLSREILPGMKERGFGRIVFVGSRATLQPPGAGMGPYAATKAGLNQLTLALAEEVRAQDINVNAVLPTVIDTPTNRKDMPEADASAWVPPSQLAEIIFSLTQPWGKPIHGALIPVAGRL